MNKIEIGFANKIMDKLYDDQLSYGIFTVPIDPEGDPSISDYRDVIKRPIDLSEIKKKLDDGEYKTAEDWKSDVMLVWDNAIKYHEKKRTKLIADLAHHFKNKLVVKLAFIPRTEKDLWFLKIQKLNREIKNLYEFRSKSFSLTEINPINEIK